MLQSCEISQLNDDLVKIALNTKEDMQVRITAADFISKHGTTSEKKRLLPLTIGKRGANTHDELKAAGLRACWPELLPAQTLFQHLTPEQHNVTSRYSLFLDGPLAAGLTAQDIGRLFQPVDPTVIDKIFEATKKSASLRETLAYWLGDVDLRSDSAKKQREAFAEHKQWTAVTASRRQQKVLVPSPTEHILALLNQSENGDASAWWKLCTWLGVDKFGYDSNSFGIEYTDKVEWQSAIWKITSRGGASS